MKTAKPTNKYKTVVLRILLLSLVGVMIGSLVYTLNAKNLMGDQLPMPFGIGASVVLSGSMEPTLSVDDLIIVKKTESYYEKQIVVFQDGGSLTVHRIHSIEGDTVTTKGDANSGFDEPISKGDIKGEVVGVIPYIGSLVLIFKQPIVSILIIAAAIFLMERSFRAEKEKKKEEVSALEKEIEELIKEIKNQK